jgi:glycosyltransferase involved in cell wall biosynthesis
MDITVLIPVYNEKNTIKEIINRVQVTEIPSEILIVDDGSSRWDTCDP